MFLGSSFAFLGAIGIVKYAADGSVYDTGRLPYVQGGIIFAGLVYLAFSLIAFLVGAERIRKIFPAVVTGPVIVVIGIQLSSIAVKDCLNIVSVNGPSVQMNSTLALNILIAFFTLAVVIVCTIFAKGFFKIVPILIGLAAGYLLCVILDFAGLFTMNYDAIVNAKIFNIPFSTKDVNGVQFMSLPKFDWGVRITSYNVCYTKLLREIKIKYFYE